jgi:Spy/CpxP family protein refolding chaperone
MSSTTIRSAAAFALTAATLAMAASAFAADRPQAASGKAVGSSDKVHCYNVHDCKGNSDCKSGNHECKGQNECKGQGFSAMGAKDCLTKGGVIADL